MPTNLPTTIPHLKLPMKLFGGKFTTVEQDTTDEIMQCVRAVIGTVRGQRTNLPDFGLDIDIVFLLKDMDITRIEAAIEEWEPRAKATVEINPQTVDNLLQAIRVLVEEEQEGE